MGWDRRGEPADLQHRGDLGDLEHRKVDFSLIIDSLENFGFWVRVRVNV